MGRCEFKELASLQPHSGMEIDQIDAGSTEGSSLETVAQELRAALGINTLEDVRLSSLNSYPLSDKLRWTNERRGA